MGVKESKNIIYINHDKGTSFEFDQNIVDILGYHAGWITGLYTNIFRGFSPMTIQVGIEYMQRQRGDHKGLSENLPSLIRDLSKKNIIGKINNLNTNQMNYFINPIFLFKCLPVIYPKEQMFQEIELFEYFNHCIETQNLQHSTDNPYATLFEKGYFSLWGKELESVYNASTKLINSNSPEHPKADSEQQREEELQKAFEKVLKESNIEVQIID